MGNELFDEALLRRYDTTAPRYTSYPTAPHPLFREFIKAALARGQHE